MNFSGGTSKPLTTAAASVKSYDNSKIEWYTIEEAYEASQAAPKKLFIDMYTDWCGWCKVMDRQTFTDSEVIQHINQNYYPVKFNAEQKEDIVWKGKTYNFLPYGRRGIHGLAHELLQGSASYPSFVILDENLNHFSRLTGFMTPEKLLPEL